MPSRFEEIARRKERLIERCARDREELAATVASIRLPLHLGSLLTAAGKAMRAYPIAAGLSSVVMTRFGVKLTRAAGRWLSVFGAIRPLCSWWSKRRRAP